MLGFALVWGFIALFAVICFTLAVSSITQYITFASARALFLGTKSLKGEGGQKEMAKQTYNDLKNKFRNEEGAGIFSPDVIDIDQMPVTGINPGEKGEFIPSSSDPNLFYGAWTKFVPKVLKIKTFFGDSGEDDAFFKTTIGSYLGREPTMDECVAFDKARWPKIKEGKMHPTVSSPPASVVIEVFDNGC